MEVPMIMTASAVMVSKQYLNHGHCLSKPYNMGRPEAGTQRTGVAWVDVFSPFINNAGVLGAAR